jgi:hypothetical protein
VLGKGDLPGEELTFISYMEKIFKLNALMADNIYLANITGSHWWEKSLKYSQSRNILVIQKC